MELSLQVHSKNTIPWIRTAGIAAAIATSFGVVQIQAGDANWPQFRGPQANPVSDNPKLVDRWSQTENVEWSVEIPGRGWSSPVVANGMVFFTTTLTDGESKSPQTGTEFSNEYVAELTKQGLSQEDILKKVTERDIELPDEVTVTYALVCLDLASGRELWTREYHQGKPPGGRHRKNSFTSETPVTDGEAVFIHAGNLGVYAYDFSGNPLWKQSLAPHPIYLDFGTGSSPILCDDRLIIMNDNEEESYLAAWNKRTGEPLWKVQRGVFPEGEAPPARSGWVTPYLWKNSVRTEIIAPGPLRLTSYDLEGNELWTMKGMGAGLAASSFAVGDQLIVNGGRGRPIFSIRPGATGDLALTEGQETNEFVTWSRPRAGTYIPTPVAYDGGLYIVSDNGIFSRLDLATGEQSYRTRVKGTDADFTTSPWAYNGNIFLASEQGEVFVIKAGTTYNLSHVNSSGELAMASPAIADDRLLLRTENRILSIREARTN